MTYLTNKRKKNFKLHYGVKDNKARIKESAEAAKQGRLLIPAIY